MLTETYSEAIAAGCRSAIDMASCGSQCQPSINGSVAMQIAPEAIDAAHEVLNLHRLH